MPNKQICVSFFSDYDERHFEDIKCVIVKDCVCGVTMDVIHKLVSQKVLGQIHSGMRMKKAQKDSRKEQHVVFLFGLWHPGRHGKSMKT